MPMDDSVHVLVVDDFSAAADSLAEALRIDGYEVRTAGDGRQALELAEALEPLCVILDINMPVMDGYELAKSLRERYDSGMVLIAMTGVGDQSDRVTKTMALVDHFLKKPVDPNLLRKLMPPAHA